MSTSSEPTQRGAIKKPKLKIGDIVTLKWVCKITGYSTLYPARLLVSTPGGIFVVKPSQLGRVK